ncbi:MAG: leucine-rich repeat protein, partial [Clostridia bacterium]|nr:leucine-rich repeat protein [Clostridia bacterium]
MKRLLGMILAILLTIAPLAGCGVGNGGDNSKPDSSGTVSSDTVSGDTTDSSTVDSDTTGSSTVDSDTTGSSTVDSDTTGSSTVDSDTTGSSTVDSDTTGSGTDDPEPACQHSSRELKYDNTRHYYECTDCFEELDSEEHIEPNTPNEKGEFKCTVCDYVIRQENGIVFKTLTVDGKNVSGSLSNGTTIFSFIDEIKTIGASKYLASFDVSGVHDIPAKTVSLEIGDNVFYIMELLNDEPVNVYKVILRRRPMYEITFDTQGGTSVESYTVEEGSIITEPSSVKIGYDLVGWDYDFTKAVMGNTTIKAIWQSRTDTKYTVNYYLQNLENDEYTLKETDTLYGETEAIVNAVIKTYEHFTHNEGKGTLSGTVTGDGNLVLSVYYTRDSYQVTTGANYDNRGEYTKIDTEYKYGSVIELSASANEGYTFVGWYENGNMVSESSSYEITVDGEINLTATFSKNTDTKYTVNYYHQNVNDDEYTLKETDTLYGETEAIVNAVIKTYEHFTHNEGKGTLSGTITGDGNLVLSVYYDREVYTVSIYNNSSHGTVTGLGTYRYGEEVTISAVAHLGYEFIGWHSEGYEPVLDAEITITIDRDLSAKLDMLEEMKIFEFTSTETECVITGVKDKSLTNIFVSSYVTEISQSAFSSCTALIELTLPFVGEKADGTGATHFGYIFGASDYSENSKYVPSGLKKVTITGGSAINRNAFYGCTGLTEITLPFVGEKADGTGATYFGYIFGASSYSYNSDYVPSSLKKVTITGGKIGSNAFSGCTGLTSVTISEGVTSIGSYAFSGCKGLTEISIPSSVTSIDSYAFEDCTGLTEITIPSSVTSIGYAAFNDCAGLKSVTIEEGVTGIGSSAFSGCTGLTEITIPSSVTSIGSYAFEDCTGLKSVTIEEGVTGIGSYAFRGCTGLTEITIPSSVTSIGSYAFEDCTG